MVEYEMGWSGGLGCRLSGFVLWEGEREAGSRKQTLDVYLLDSGERWECVGLEVGAREEVVGRVKIQNQTVNSRGLEGEEGNQERLGGREWLMSGIILV